jgi:glycine/D-amino acid oxidase-like deaminating enzyme
VTILEAHGPGEGCTSGNGGQLVAGYCVPVGLPGIVRQVPHMLWDPLGPLTIRWRYLPRLLPWLLRFIAASSKRRAKSIADALHALSRGPLDALGPLIASAGAEHLIVRRGRLDVYATNAGFERARRKYELLQARGVQAEPVSGDEAADLEPALAGRVRRGVLLPETAHVTDPLRMTQLLAQDFVEGGGVIACERVNDFEIGPTGPVAVLTDAGRRAVDRVVVAAGAHSR